MDNRRSLIIPETEYEKFVWVQYRDHDLTVVFPKELQNEAILKNNISEMLQVIEEYISEYELYKLCCRKADEFYFDIQKNLMFDEANVHCDKVNELYKVINKNLFPYFWAYLKGPYKDINEHRLNCTYIVYLDKTK